MMEFTIEGKKVSFQQFLEEMGGSGVVYEDDIEDLLHKWESGDWEYAYTTLAPIASQILIDAAEVNPEIYAKLMRTIVESYQILKRDLGLKPRLIRIK